MPNIYLCASVLRNVGITKCWYGIDSLSLEMLIFKWIERFLSLKYRSCILLIRNVT